MAPQRLDKIESAPGSGMVSEASTHKIWYTGARLPCPTPADVPRAGRTPREEGAARGGRRLSTRLVRRRGSSADSVVITESMAAARPRRKFSALQSLENSENRKGISILRGPVSGGRRPRSRSPSTAAARPRRKFSALQSLENSQNGERISILHETLIPL
jgi:hypothetical protein